MQIAPLLMSDPWSDRIQRDREIDTDILEGLPSEIVVSTSEVEILHHTEALKFRPYLHLQGKITELIPGKLLPYGIEKLPFSAESGPRFDAFYEFTDEQLSTLAQKGYFTEAFTVPDEISDAEWQFAAEVNYHLVYPETTDEPPVVFVDVPDRFGAVLTEENSAYDLHNYFPDHSAELENILESEATTEHQEQESLQPQSKSLFSDEELEVDELDEVFISSDAPEASQSHVPETIFSALVEQVRNRQDELFADEDRDQDEDSSRITLVQDQEPAIPHRASVKELYRTRMAPSIAEALAAENTLLSDVSSSTSDVDDSVAEELDSSARARAHLEAMNAAERRWPEDEQAQAPDDLDLR